MLVIIVCVVRFVRCELKMLGIAISECTISGILRTIRLRPAVSDLQDVSVQSPRPDRVGRLLYGSDHRSGFGHALLEQGAVQEIQCDIVVN
jgi:hypothetical protein